MLKTRVSKPLWLAPSPVQCLHVSSLPRRGRWGFLPLPGHPRAAGKALHTTVRPEGWVLLHLKAGIITVWRQLYSRQLLSSLTGNVPLSCWTLLCLENFPEPSPCCYLLSAAVPASLFPSAGIVLAWAKSRPTEFIPVDFQLHLI